AVVKESRVDERRVAATPDTVSRLIKKLGFEVSVEAGAGEAAGFSDDSFAQAGAHIAQAGSGARQADVVLKVNPPTLSEVMLLPEQSTLISFVWPGKSSELVEQLRARQVTTFAMDAVPRVSRAQKMDALSSMANISGYRAVTEAANLFG